jgi:hypothetical protein
LVEFGSLRRVLYSGIQFQGYSQQKKIYTVPSKRVTKIHSSITLFEGFQKDIKFYWKPFQCGVVDIEIADYLAKK